MTDVFISYAREDRDRAHKLADALAAFGWSVWWDRKIITGEAFDQAIERELETAKSIVVLWSEHSIASEWVKSEAAVASERGVLVPALIDSVKLPLEFRRKQTADLIGWDGEPSHSGLQALCEGISARIPISRPWMSEDSAQWVGRERSLQRLHHHLERALGGERQVVFVSGEAGIGKTTLIEIFLRGMSMPGPGVLWGRCIEHFGGGEALLPLIEAPERQCRSAGGAGLVAKLRHYAPTWLAQMPAVLTPSEREALQREVLGATKERMLREFCELLEALSREGPLVLVLEDLHWSDYATLDVLTLLARRRDRAPLLIIGTHRPVEVVLRRHPLRAVQQELQIHGLCTELPLDNLSSAEVSAYLAQRFPGNEVPEVVAEVIYRRTEGHPLFMVNLIAYLIAEGRLVQREGRWTLPQGEASLDVGVPDNLRQMITHQIERLSPEEQRLLGAASAAGMACSAALLAAALNAAPSNVESCCEALVRHGQMLATAGVEEWPDGTVAGRYAFLHALYVEILYRRLAPGSRVELHRRLGERLGGLRGTLRRDRRGARPALRAGPGRAASDQILTAGGGAGGATVCQPRGDRLSQARLESSRAPPQGSGGGGTDHIAAAAGWGAALYGGSAWRGRGPDRHTL